MSRKPKFYFFDPGVVRTLMGLGEIPLAKQTHGYGNAFEHFIITQCKLLASYTNRNFRFSYLSTKDGAEIDLVVERPGQPLLLVEIKSSSDVQAQHLNTLNTMLKEIENCEAICLSRDPFSKVINHITVYPWEEGVKRYFAS